MNIRAKIYRENAARIFETTNQIDDEYIKREAEKFLLVPNKKCVFADEDLHYILNELQK